MEGFSSGRERGPTPRKSFPLQFSRKVHTAGVRSGLWDGVPPLPCLHFICRHRTRGRAVAGQQRLSQWEHQPSSGAPPGSSDPRRPEAGSGSDRCGEETSPASQRGGGGQEKAAGTCFGCCCGLSTQRPALEEQHRQGNRESLDPSDAGMESQSRALEGMRNHLLPSGIRQDNPS